MSAKHIRFRDLSDRRIRWDWQTSFCPKTKTSDVERLRSISESEQEDGDTLLEILIALLVISVTVVALLTGYVSSIGGSATHQNLTEIDVMLRDVAESATYQIQQGGVNAPLFVPCAMVSGFAATSSLGAASNTLYYGPLSGYPASEPTIDVSNLIPAGYSLSLNGSMAIQYWNASKIPSWTSACPNSSGNQVQLITLTGYGPHGTSDSLQFAVINPDGKP